MKLTAVAMALVAVLALGGSGAQARGCVKGAVVGGIAGHLVHHGWLGAAAGCAIGHHEATRHY